MDSKDYLEKSGWRLDKGFKEVPGYLLGHPAGILELEARALVKSLRKIANSNFGHDIRQLLLTDNMSACLAFDRSRARSYRLLQQVRKFSSYCLSRNIYCSVRWVPSELNRSDEPSRVHSDVSTRDWHMSSTIKRLPEGESFEAPLGEAKVCEAEDKDTLCSRECESCQPSAFASGRVQSGVSSLQRRTGGPSTF